MPLFLLRDPLLQVVEKKQEENFIIINNSKS